MGYGKERKGMWNPEPEPLDYEIVLTGSRNWVEFGWVGLGRGVNLERGD